MKNKQDDKKQIIEQNKREKLEDINEKIIDINKKEAELKKTLKHISDAKKAKDLKVEISQMDVKKKRFINRAHKIELDKFKNFFKFRRKYKELMYSPTRSSIMFRLTIVTIAAFIVTFGLHFFIHPGHTLYTGGLRTVQQIILFSTDGKIPEWSTYLIFFGLNLPLAYFGWKYIGKWFTILTLYFLVIQAGFEELLNLPYLKENLENPSIGFKNLLIIKTDHDGNIISGNASVYISALIGAVIYGFGVALTFVAGASSGGTKFIVAWLQKKYNMSLGKGSVVIAVIMISLGLLINGIIIDHRNFFSVYLSTATFATAAFIVVQASIQNLFAPRSKKTSISIITSNIEKVMEVIDTTILARRVWYTYKIKKNKDKKQSSVVVLTVDRREAEFIIGKLTRRLPSSQITYHDTNLHSDKFIVRGFD